MEKYRISAEKASSQTGQYNFSNAVDITFVEVLYTSMLCTNVP